jgi:DNA polymerase-4
MRDILHLYIPAFPLAVARVADPGLRDRPLAVAPGNSERALLQCVSAEARAEGVREGMPVFRARRFCPSLQLLLPDPESTARAARELVETAATYTPLWEPATPGRLYLDLTGSGRLMGPGRDAAARMEKEIAGRLRLQGTVGVAGNKLVARIASGYLDKPGVCDVLRGSEESFIGPLPVTVLPGVGGARAELLEELNLRRVAEVAALAVAQLRLACGPFASLLHQRARGLDPSPVQPPRRKPEVAEDTFLPQEENDDALLLAELCRLAEGCGLRLRRLGKGARKLLLTVRFADGVTEQGSTLFLRPENRDLPLMAAAEELFYRVCRRRLRVRSLRLGAGRLEGEDRQLDLFALPPESLHREPLQEALDRLRERYGMGAVRWGKCI